MSIPHSLLMFRYVQTALYLQTALSLQVSVDPLGNVLTAPARSVKEQRLSVHAPEHLVDDMRAPDQMLTNLESVKHKSKKRLQRHLSKFLDDSLSGKKARSLRS